MADEFAEAKAAFRAAVAALDASIECVIPTRSTGNNFLIGLQRGNAKKFLTLSEEDLLDFAEDEEAREEITGRIRERIAELG